jgi:hypothetical protein
LGAVHFLNRSGSHFVNFSRGKSSETADWGHFLADRGLSGGQGFLMIELLNAGSRLYIVSKAVVLYSRVPHSATRRFKPNSTYTVAFIQKVLSSVD